MPLDPTLPPVVGIREDRLPPGTTIPPEVQAVPCAGCGASLLLSPSSLALIASGQAQPACTDCAADLLRGQHVPATLTPGGAEELQRYQADDARRN